jgi:DNA-binding NtrC family response regulator
MKVMLIDDDATTLAVLSALLEDEGYEVVTRTEALGTSHAIHREQPQVAVVDVRMPGLNGDRLAGLIVKSHPSLTVILHSSLPATDLERLSRVCGAAGFVEKKKDPGESVKALVNIIRKRAVGTIAPPSAPSRPK